MALATVLGLGHLLATPSMWPVDETAHIAYAESLVRTGTPPHIDDPLPQGVDARAIPGLTERLRWEQDQNRDGRQDIWLSNHPPAAYLIQGVAFHAGRALAGGTLAVTLARATSVVWMAVGVWATMALATLLAGASPARDRRRLSPDQIGLAAGLLVAVTPTLSHLAGVAFTDVPAFTTSTLCLLLGARIALEGPTPLRLYLLGPAIGLAVAVRTTSLPAAGIAGLLGLYGWWGARRGETDALADRSRRRTWPDLRGLIGPALVAAVALTPAAVWALRNAALYGSVTASSYLLDKFERDVNAGAVETLVSSDSWLRLATRMVADLTTGHWNVGLRRDTVQLVLTLLFGAGLWWLLLTLRARHDQPPRSGSVRHTRHVLRATWALLSAVPISLAVAALLFHASGGSLHGRYVLAGHAVVVIAAVVWLSSLPRWSGVAVAVVAGLLLIVDLSLIWGVFAEDSGNWTRTTIRIQLPYVAGVATPWLLGVATALSAWLFRSVAGQLVASGPPVERHRDASRPQVAEESVGRVVGVDAAVGHGLTQPG